MRTTTSRRAMRAAMAIAGIAAAHGAAAQSSVTLYGRVVGGLEYVSKARVPDSFKTYSYWKAADNHWGTSMLGVKGVEDLGGNLKAEFVLEGGFSLMNGKANGGGDNVLTNRRSYVGLIGNWGNLRLGKNLLISNDVWYLDPTGQQFMGSATLVRNRSWYGNQNVIEYATPDFGGFGASVQVGLGEVPGSSRKLRNQGVSLKYINGDLELRGIYTERYDENGRFSDIYSYSKELTIGGTYRIGNAKLFAAYDQLRAPDAPLGVPTRANHGWLGVRYDLTPQLTLIGAAYRINTNRADGRATLLMVGADYALSKRTFLYASLGGTHNSGGGNFAADVSADGPGPNAKQKVVYFGFGHSF